MSLLDVPWAASSTISRSRPDSGTAAATWSSPGVTAPSQMAARTLDRRCAAAAAFRSPARDARELAAAADDFEALGAMLLAAEAAAGAAQAFGRAGDRKAAAAAQRRSSV